MDSMICQIFEPGNFLENRQWYTIAIVTKGFFRNDKRIELFKRYFIDIFMKDLIEQSRI